MRRSFIISVGAIVFGTGLSAKFATLDRFFFVGLVLVLLGTADLLQKRSADMIERTNRPADVAYELGYQMGYDRGYTEGHRAARPVVVPLQREASDDSFSPTSMR